MTDPRKPDQYEHYRPAKRRCARVFSPCHASGEHTDYTDSGSGWTVYCDCEAGAELREIDALVRAVGGDRPPWGSATWVRNDNMDWWELHYQDSVRMPRVVAFTPFEPTETASPGLVHLLEYVPSLRRDMTVGDALWHALSHVRSFWPARSDVRRSHGQ